MVPLALACAASVACARPGDSSFAKGPVASQDGEPAVASKSSSPDGTQPRALTSDGDEPGASPAASGETRVVELDVPGHRPAIVSVPPGSKSAPVMVAAHGAGDRAEEQCAYWAHHVGRHAFILCPRGVPMNRHPQTGWFFRHHHALGKEVQAALTAFRAQHPRGDTRSMVFTGYSQGATMGALHAHTVPGQLSRLLLIEGGFGEWDVPTAKKFLLRGGKRVVLLCGITHCAHGAKRGRAMLARGKVPVRIEYVKGGGHTYGGSVGERAVKHLAWLVEDDERWTRWRKSRE